MTRHWKPLVAGIAMGAGLGAGAILMVRGIRGEDRPREISAAAGRHLFDAVRARITRSWVDTISEDEMYRRAAMGLIAELGDAGTEYLTPQRVARLQESATGTYSGVGMSLSSRAGIVVVTHVRVGTPAERAGIAIGDRLLEVDGKSMRGWTVGEALGAIRGPAGTRVSLTIERNATTARIPLQLERDEIHVTSVTRARLLGTGVGYFLLSAFNDSTAADVARTVDSLTSVGARRFVMDLRGNPGGVLNQGVDVADLFLGAGQRIASTKGRLPEANAEFVDRTAERWAGRPLVVLVNANTASSAEIVAGALQDNDRALIVGLRTYGKGSAQHVLRLEDGGAIKLTGARWYTPLGRSLEHTTTAEDEVGAAEDSARHAVKTRRGRVLMGGGGVQPDIVAGDSVLSAAERAWVRAVGDRVSDFRRALTASAQRNAAAARRDGPLFTVTQAMRDALYNEMRSRGLAVQRGIFDDARATIDLVLGQELAVVAFGIPGAQQRATMTDPVVSLAVELLEGVETADALFERANAGRSRPRPTASGI